MGAIQDAIVTAKTATDRDRIRAHGARDAILALPRTGGKLEVVRGLMTLTMDGPPEDIYNHRGDPVGVGTMLRAFRDGSELHVDPHRVITNPPALVGSGIFDPVIETRPGGRTETVQRERMREDPVEAWLRTLEDSLRTAPNPAGWNTRGTVTTVYAGTSDGLVQSYDSAYSTARSGTNLTADTTSSLSAGQSYDGLFYYYATQSFVSFDTSAITDSDTVSAIVLASYLYIDNSTTNFVTQAREHDWGASLTTADWVAGASLSSKTLMASIDSNGIGAAEAYKSFTSEAAFLTATNLKTGTVYLLLCSAEQTNNSAPTDSEELLWYSANEAGTTKDPKLTITHAGASATHPGWAHSRGGWW